MKTSPAPAIRIQILPAMILAALASLSLAQPSAAQEKIVFPYGAVSSPVTPFGGPVMDQAGNLYVATAGSTSASGYAVVYQLIPPATSNAQWGVLNIANISGGMNAGLTIDHAGHLYGTATGGSNNTGYAFELFYNGTWNEKILYNFPSTFYATPASPLILDPGGNLYGASYNGPGQYYTCGAIFELVRVSSSVRTESTLYSFTGPTDGCQPSGVVLDQHGNLYGQTLTGGANSNGTIFELSPPSTSGGSWTFQTLYTFPTAPAPPLKAPPNKSVPPKGIGGLYENTLTIDPEGNLYGTLAFGGSSGNGLVFELSPPSSSGGSWTYSNLYSFAGSPDGAMPAGGLIRASNDVLYGTTFFGGPVTQYGGQGYPLTGLGTVFQLTPPANSGGTWTEKVLHNFSGGFDGYYPVTSPILNSKGLLYGATTAGGNNNFNCRSSVFYTGCGTVYQVVP